MGGTASQINAENSRPNRFDLEEVCLQIKKAVVAGNLRGRISRIERIKGGVQSSFRVWTSINLNGRILWLSDFVVTLEQLEAVFKNFDVDRRVIDGSKDLESAILIGRIFGVRFVSTPPTVFGFWRISRLRLSPSMDSERARAWRDPRADSKGRNTCPRLPWGGGNRNEKGGKVKC